MGKPFDSIKFYVGISFKIDFGTLINACIAEGRTALSLNTLKQNPLRLVLLREHVFKLKQISCSSHIFAYGAFSLYHPRLKRDAYLI